MEEIHTPLYMESQLPEILGVSQEETQELIKSSNFPMVHLEHGMMRYWRCIDIDRFVETMKKKNEQS